MLRARARIPVVPRDEIARNTFLTAMLLLVALFAPLYGMVFSGLGAWHQDRQGHRTMRNLALGAFALAVIAFVDPGIVPQVGPSG